jgi:hypothetical protein
MKSKIYLLLVGTVAAIAIFLLYSRLGIAVRELKSSKCAFKIDFYGTPSEEDTQIDYESAFSRKVSYESTNDGASYRVDCFLFKDPNAYNNDAIDGVIGMMTANGKYDLVSKADTLVDGITGKEFLIDFKDRDIVGRARMAIKGDWLYSIMVVGQRSGIYGSSVKKFLDSFRFDGME